MENVEIAALLDEVADLLEIQEANPFRVRAYRNAVRTVAAQTTPMRQLVEDGADLTELPAIGKEMARHIAEAVMTGSMSVRDDLADQVPRSLIDLMRLPGVGPKKARALWDELGIESIEDLKEAAEAGRVAELKGFGAKTQDRILQGIERYTGREQRFLLSEIDEVLPPLLAYLRETPGVERIEVAGSYRRRRSTIGDVDLLVLADDIEPVSDRLTSYPPVAEVLARGGKTSVRLRTGLQVDLRVVPPESWGAALVYFTGSKEHNIKLRQRALERGLRISEYGVYRPGEEDEGLHVGERSKASEGERVAGATEAEVYGTVDLDWIDPTLREDRGELTAAAAGTLPRLIERGDIRGDLQMHSTWSDGRASVEGMFQACAALGYEYFALTDHSKALAMVEGLDAEKLQQQWVEIDEVQSRYPEIRLLKSLEVDILKDGRLDLEDEMLEQLEVVVVSIHSYFGLDRREQTRRVLKAIEHPSVHIIGHPTGRILNRRDPIDFDLDTILQACAEHNVAVELNAHPNRLDLADTHLMRAKELGVKVVISTDAHRPDELLLMSYGIEQARRAWLEPGDVLNTLGLDDFRGAIRRDGG